MTNADIAHFDDYRRQTVIKHQILTQYLRPYFDILKTHHARLVYIDGFAGRGSYATDESGRRSDGSPLLALRLISERLEFARRVDTVFIEANERFFGELSTRVRAFCAENPGVQPPLLRHGRFEDEIDALLDVIQGQASRLPPTFMFVDPCGVEGVDFKSIIRVLAAERCEVFLFFNMEGIRRILGLADAGGVSPALVSFFGSADRVVELRSLLKATESSLEREQVVVGAYRAAINRLSGADYILPFRIESEGRRTTSHYLIHATKNALGFKIMKHIMWEAGRGDGQEGRLELLQASAGDLGAMMRADLRDLEEAILARVSHRPARAEEFYDQWVCRPTDPFTEGCYRRILLQLEAERRIQIRDSSCQHVVDATMRPMRKGQVTLGKSYWVTKA